MQVRVILGHFGRILLLLLLLGSGLGIIWHLAHNLIPQEFPSLHEKLR